MQARAAGVEPLDREEVSGATQALYVLDVHDSVPLRLAKGENSARMSVLGGCQYRDIDFSNAKRGAIVKPEPGKTKISIRLDNAVLEYFRDLVDKAGGGSYQTSINDALLEYIHRRSTVDVDGLGNRGQYRRMNTRNLAALDQRRAGSGSAKESADRFDSAEPEQPREIPGYAHRRNSAVWL